MTIIHIIEPVVGGPSILDGQYLKHFDANARGGHGVVEATSERADAMHFDSAGDAFNFWRQQSTVLPLRPDGRPNRPLTAYTVSFEPDDGPGFPI